MVFVCHLIYSRALYYQNAGEIGCATTQLIWYRATTKSKTSQALYIDCGSQDQFHIHYGNRQLSQALHDANANHRYTEFVGTHSGIDHRLILACHF